MAESLWGVSAWLKFQRRFHRYDLLIHGVTIFITFLKEFGADHAFLIHEHRSRIQNAFQFLVPDLFSRDFLILDCASDDRLAARIGKQRERDVLYVRKFFQYFDRVVADANHLNALRLDAI